MENKSELSESALRDLKLVIAARAGDEQAFTKLMKYYADAIYFMLLKMVYNKDDAEDLTIEVFGKAFTHIHQYEPEYAFSTWLFRIASNNAIDHLRKRKKKVDTVSIDGTIETRNGFPTENLYHQHIGNENPEEAFIKKQNARIIRKAVSNIKPRYRTLLEMRYFHEYTYSEMAKELNLPLGTIKVQLFRSREMLLSLLKKTEMKGS